MTRQTASSEEEAVFFIVKLSYGVNDSGQLLEARRGSADLFLLRTEDGLQGIAQHLLEVGLGVEGTGEFKLEGQVHDHFQIVVGVGPEN